MQFLEARLLLDLARHVEQVRIDTPSVKFASDSQMLVDYFEFCSFKSIIIFYKTDYKKYKRIYEAKL